MNSGGEIADLEPRRHRERHLRDHLATPFGHDARPEKASIAVSDQLDEPNAVAFGDGTVYALQVRRGCTNILAEALPRLSLREPDLRDLRNRKGDLGQDRRRPTGASG